MKINNLDFEKIRSDFMFLGIDNPEENAKIIFDFKYTLTAHGFEKYIQYYFTKFRGYKIQNPKTNLLDNGIDLKGIKKEENGEIKYLLIQCKKYGMKDISQDLVASFYGNIVDKLINVRNKTNIFYITTSKFTKKARDFLESKKIRAIDFSNICRLQKVYSLEKFKFDLKNEEGQKEYEKCFEKEHLILNLDKKSNNITDNETLKFLKQIRKDCLNLIENKQLKLYNIATNDTLTLLSRKRPHNTETLKEAIKDLKFREKNKIEKYGDIFIQRLKYLQKI